MELDSNITAADHPHGGGRGKSKGNVDPVSPWGMPVSLEKCFLLFDYEVADMDDRPKEVTRPVMLGSLTSGW